MKKSYGSVAVVASASASFGPGIHLIEGDNGVGKTTLLAMMVGLVSPTVGRVQVCGRDLADRSDLTRGMLAFAPARPIFLEDVSVDFAVRLFLSLRGRVLERDVFACFDPFHLRDHASVLFSDLSLGWKKRVLLHMAFVADAEVLVLDEPTVGLDRSACDTLTQLINARREFSVTVMTCHDPSSLALDHVQRHRLRRAGVFVGSHLSSCDDDFEPT